MSKTSKTENQTQLDFIIPAFNEEQIIEITYKRLVNVTENLNLSCNFIFIDDGSTDNTWTILASLAEKDKRIKLIKFSRNFGHQIAITAGLEHSQAKYSLIIDADLQDPPELVSEMLETAKSGYDIIYGVRITRQGESFTKKLTANIFYRTINLFLDFAMPQNVGDFRLVSDKARKLFLQIHDKARLNREIWAWIGLPQTAIKYERPARIAGKSKYNLIRMLKLAFDGITSSGDKPLLIILLTAFLLMISGFILIFTNITASLIVISSAIILIFIWLAGTKIAQTYKIISDRPEYIIESIKEDC